MNEAVSEREREKGMVVLLKLSQSLAVQHMTSLQGLCVCVRTHGQQYKVLSPLTDALALVHYSTHTNTAALALATTTNIAMATTNGVSSSSHVTELMDQVIETLLVGDFSEETNSLGMSCLLRSLVKLSSQDGSTSQSAMDTLLSLLPQCTG